VAIDAFVRRVFVHHDLFVSHHPRLHMALGTRNIGVPTGQGKMRLGVMVKGRRRPALRIVAIGTVSLIVLGQELAVVGIFVAGFALRRGALEARFRVGGRFVASGAGDRAMGAHKGEFCL